MTQPSFGDEARNMCPHSPRERLSPFLEISFRADPAAMASVRRGLRAALHECGLEEIAEDVVLAAQELMSNAVVHGCRSLAADTQVTITVACTTVLLRVAVHDPSDELPQPRADSDTPESGRGLKITAAVADRWGVEKHRADAGKSVWIELDSPHDRGL
ncbi:ATP-binding protein [Streptomyces sp. NPDC058864]